MLILKIFGIIQALKNIFCLLCCLKTVSFVKISGKLDLLQLSQNLSFNLVS